jgi:hypothetical protein
MLSFENISAQSLAYDRPSPKLIGFLRKYFGLGSYISQNNNFVLFNEYFEHLKTNKQNTSKYKSDNKFQDNSVTNSNSHNILNTRSNFANVGLNMMINSSLYNPKKTSVDNDDPYNLSNTSQFKPNNITKELSKHKAFPNYFLNNHNTNYYDQIYSKKKLQLLNDFISNEKLNQDEYVK